MILLMFGTSEAEPRNSGLGLGIGEMGHAGERAQTFSYKMSKSGDLMHSMVTVVNSTALCT